MVNFVACPCWRIGSLLLLVSSSALAQQPASVMHNTLADVAAGQLRLIDLSYPLNSKTHFWPGPKYQPFRIETIATLEDDGVLSKQLSFPEHIGTHIDAPNHFESGQRDVSQIPAQQFFAPGVLIDVSVQAQLDPDYAFSPQDLATWEEKHGAVPAGAIVLLRTGWGDYWSEPARYLGRDVRGTLHFPGCSAEAARILIEQRKITGFGIDTLSVDPGNSKTFATHHQLGKAQCYGLENVAYLEKLPATGFFLFVAPLKVEQGTGGPCRIFAVLPGEAK